MEFIANKYRLFDAEKELRGITLRFNDKRLRRRDRDALIPRAQEIRNLLFRECGYSPEEIKAVEFGTAPEIA